MKLFYPTLVKASVVLLQENNEITNFTNPYSDTYNINSNGFIKNLSYGDNKDEK